MTPEQEYEEAANRIENFLVDFDISSGDVDCYEPTDLRQLYHDAARRLLALTWPSGQPVIGVISQNQVWPDPKHLWSDPAYPNGHRDGPIEAMQQGFRRVETGGQEVKGKIGPYRTTERELYERFLSEWGIDAQLGMLQEECAELIVAASKVLRRKPNAMAGLTEELADVQNMVNQIALICPDFDGVRLFKLERTRKLLPDIQEAK